MSNNNTATASKFPEEIKVSVVLTIRVNSQEERDAYIDPVTGLTSPAFLLDLLDLLLDQYIYCPYAGEEITELNGLSFDELNALNRLNSGL
jgi:hypothetical protein